MMRLSFPSLMFACALAACQAPEDGPLDSGSAAATTRPTAKLAPEQGAASVLRYRFDLLSTWPALDVSKLRGTCTEGTTVTLVGSGGQALAGEEAILEAFETLQGEHKNWRLVLWDTFETASRVVTEFEIWDCESVARDRCRTKRHGLLYGRLDRGKLQSLEIYLSSRWLPQREAARRQRPTRWVRGRRNPQLELLFAQIWQGELSAWLAPTFLFRDQATGLELKGPKAFAQHRDKHASFLADGRCRVDELHSTGDIVLVLSTCEGTLRRPIRGQDRRLEVHVADVGRFVDSKLVELRSYSNDQEALSQLGVWAEQLPSGGTP